MNRDFNSEYLGYQFIWFFGIVEDRLDPLKLGRVRVRCFSWHSEDKQKVPTKALPWAQCIQDISNAATSGIGRSPTGLVEGSWVFGFFLDGEDAQKPMVLGVLPGIPQTGSDTTKGFNDPEGRYPNILNEPDVSRLARNENIHLTSVQSKKDTRDLSIPIANTTNKWNQPHNPYNARYPYNHVWQTESGHIIELDDSAGSERINIYHTKGTFIEIDSNGTKVSKTIGNQYEILEANGYIHVKGSANITVDGDANFYIKNNANMDVDGDLNIKVRNDFNLEVSGNTHISTKEEFRLLANSIGLESFNGPINQYANGSFNIYSTKNIDFKSLLNTNIDANKIYMNSDRASTADKSSLNQFSNRITTVPAPVTPFISLNRDDLYAIYYDDEYAQGSSPPASYIPEIVAAGAGTIEELETIPSVPLPDSGKNDTTIPQTVSPTNNNPDTTINNKTEFPDTYKLSTNFNLGQLSSRAVVSKYKVIDQVGLTKAEIVQNLKGVAENILEPIFAKYPDMIITSGFRLGTGKSQHFKGQAIDIKFRNATKKQYFERAKEIKNLIPYDQFLLEYKNTGTGLPWLHISFNFNGNRNQILTFFNHRKHSSGLTQLA